MKCQNNNDEYEYLTSKGFKIDWFDDMSSWWFIKLFKTKIFGTVEVIISDFEDDGQILCTIIDENGKFHEEDFIKYSYSRENLKKILKLIKTK